MSIILYAAILGYLLGSIPFGLILTKMAGLGDIRAIGSGNIGATNVLRSGKKGLAAATLLLDGLKGTFAVIIASKMWGHEFGIIAGLGAFLGHIFPIWLKFKGGKGVATYLGVLFATYWPLGLLFIGVWLLVAYLFRYSSLAALIGAALTPLALLFTGYRIEASVYFFMTVLLFFMHRANISRLVEGSESKIGQK